MKRDMFCILTIILFSSLIFLLGCNKDDNGSNPTAPQNHAPVIQSVTAQPSIVQADPSEYCHYPSPHLSVLTCNATDAEEDYLSYYWSSQCGSFYGNDQIGYVVWWCSPASPCTCIVHVLVTDGEATDEDSVSIAVF